jgi:predicted nucleic acid-binding protein
MTHRIFVDTGAWIALADGSDDLHDRALTIYPTVLQAGNRLVTTNLVIAESYNLIRRRVGHQAAMQFLESMRTSPRLDRVYSDQSLELSGEAILRRYADQAFSFVDAVSFAAMLALDIDEAFAFDNHFVVAGFKLVQPQ